MSSMQPFVVIRVNWQFSHQKEHMPAHSPFMAHEYLHISLYTLPHTVYYSFCKGVLVMIKHTVTRIPRMGQTQNPSVAMS